MRVTSNMMFNAGMTALQAQQQELLQAQLQSSTGLKIQRPSDDPSGTFRDLLFSADLSGVTSLKRTTDLAAQRLENGDKTIGVMHDSMMAAYELAMQFSPGTSANDPEILKGAAISALGIYQNILSIANQEMDGVPLFGGGRTVTPFDDSNLKATAVRVQSKGTGSANAAPDGFVPTVADGFAPPAGQTGSATTYTIAPSGTGSYDVYINGVRQALPVSPIARSGMSDYLDLGNGVTFNMGGTLLNGENLSFSVVRDGAHYKATQTQLFVDGASTPSTVDVTSGFSAQITDSSKWQDLPLSVKMSYQASSGEYAININGIDQVPVKAKAATIGQPSYVDLGNGLTFNLVSPPKEGDVYYFEVVPSYQGGKQDRPIQVSGGRTLPGNVSGAELIEGSGSVGRDINVLGALAALRGALLRGDANEVGIQLARLDAGRGQTSDMQSLTGVRSTQMDATNSMLATDEVSLQSLKTGNSEADAFEVLSRLQKASQSLQMLTGVERQVLNMSLLDFLG
ncbi:hypothetical protein [Candidatus Magnetaquicoccus inordinatus]|uniref:flagellin N-terminal helical domain-containing protein n=1 Tax=Candidatus Magnetaquicoccus inordinatus TaxID=2496818 RepID=UPI00102B32D9|nr:hypothetical protein [Candidatus Magnetaquicoccus inordinatus]